MSAPSAIGVRPSRYGAIAMALLAVITYAKTVEAADTVRVEGTPQSLRIEVQSMPVEVILDSLGEKFHVSYSASAPLKKTITGTYEGSLKQVIARVLDGYNYVLKSSGETMDINVLGASGQNAVVTAPAAPIKAMEPADAGGNATEVSATAPSPHQADTASETRSKHKKRLDAAMLRASTWPSGAGPLQDVPAAAPSTGSANPSMRDAATLIQIAASRLETLQRMMTQSAPR